MVRKNRTKRKSMFAGRILNKDMKPLHKSMDKSMKKLHKSMKKSMRRGGKKLQMTGG